VSIEVSDGRAKWSKSVELLEGLWTQLSNASWAARSGHAAVSFGGKIWLTGGYDGGPIADVFSSTAGTSWTEESSPQWSARYNHESLVFNEKMWILRDLASKTFSW